MSKLKRIIAASVLVLVQAIAIADQPYSAKNITLSQFSKWVADQTGINVIYSTDKDIRTDIYLPSYDHKTVIDMFKAVMASRGLNVVYVDGYYVVTDKSEEQNFNDFIPKIQSSYKLQNTVHTQIADVLNAIYANDLELGDTTVNSINYSHHDNTVHYSGTYEFVSRVAKTVKELDAKTPTYQIRALVFETEVGHADRVGFNFRALVDRVGASITNTSPVIGGSLSYASADFQAIYDAVVSDSKNRIVSTPSILVENAQTGYFTVGQTVPFITSTTNTDGGVTQSVEREDVGVSLRITPSYINNTTARFNINQSISSISENALASDIVTNQRLLQTVVDLRQSDVVFLGGLITDRIHNRTVGVPGLRNLPALKHLFTYKSSSTVQTELNVLLSYTPI